MIAAGMYPERLKEVRMADASGAKVDTAEDRYVRAAALVPNARLETTTLGEPSSLEGSLRT